MELISRKALIEKIEKRIPHMIPNVLGTHDVTAEGMVEFIKSQPTVEAVSVVHGEWKEATPKGVHSWSKGYARCSACDETIWSGWEMNFCPNCGCDMRTSAE